MIFFHYICSVFLILKKAAIYELFVKKEVQMDSKAMFFFC